MTVQTAQQAAAAINQFEQCTWALAALAGLAESFASGGRFLDIGTGVGELGAAFAEFLPAAHVVGIDVLPRALELARRVIAVTRWQTLRASGTPLSAADARLELAAVGLVQFTVFPTPVGAPALYAARRPERAGR